MVERELLPVVVMTVFALEDTRQAMGDYLFTSIAVDALEAGLRRVLSGALSQV